MEEFELHQAVVNGDHSLVKELLENYYNGKDKGFFFILSPIFSILISLVFFLKKKKGKGKEKETLDGRSKGIDVNRFNQTGRTPLHLAASKGLKTIAKLLLDAGLK